MATATTLNEFSHLVPPITATQRCTGFIGREYFIEIVPYSVDSRYLFLCRSEMSAGFVDYTKRPINRSGINMCLNHTIPERFKNKPIQWTVADTPGWDKCPYDVQPKDPTEKRLTCVYFFLAPAAGVVKIGKSDWPDSRLEQVRSLSPVDIELLHAIPGVPHALERQLHRRFAAYRSHGEWFHYEGELQKFVEESMGA